ncbi:hypothetical protein [Streptomyces sp. NPDC051109]|uniref:hypothetical protein n=1 Tax=Streptomyces sp. NPDC051109 TaxID=3365642 RepID=UPI0037AD6BCC
MLDEAHAEHTKRSRTAQDQTESEQRTAAEDKEVRRLREHLMLKHPELAAFAQPQT